MKKLTLYALLTFLFTAAPSVSAQSMLDVYFGGSKEALMHEATRLIQMPDPVFLPAGQQAEPDPAWIAEMGFEQLYETEPRHFTVRDHKQIFAYRFPNPSENTIILMHGTGSSAYMYNKTAGLLQVATQAEIYAVDLRGHGFSEGNSGDVDYIGQYADDLADLVQAIRDEKPNGKIIIAGHSMGGGIALRYAMNASNHQVDGFLLFAPLLGHNSPAMMPAQPAENSEDEPFMKIHIERIIGLSLLSEIGNSDYHSLPVLFFNVPADAPLRTYSYRANRSMAPDDYAAGLSAVTPPLLVLIGSADEAFSATATRQAVQENSRGEIQIIEGASHNGVRHHAQSFVFIKDWFSAL